MTILLILMGIHLTLHSIECGYRLWERAQKARNTRRLAKPSVQPFKETAADRREALRLEKERENFLTYTGDEQPTIDEEALLRGDVQT